MKQNKSERFARTRLFLGRQGFNNLQNSFVTVVGLGAVGGFTVEALARAGVGRLRLIDFDIIQTSNLNRQLLALEETIGLSKAQTARQRVFSINPECKVEALDIFAAQESLEQIFTPKPDLLIDAIDSMNPKMQLLAGAHENDIPTLSSMGAALRSDPSKVKTGDLSETTNCPLAKRLRKMLRRHYNIETGITCVYSTEKVDFTYSFPQPSDSHIKAPHEDRGRKRNVLGSLPTLTGIFGLTLANLAIQKLAHHKQ